MGTKDLWIIFWFNICSFKIWCISIRVSDPFIHWTKYLGPHHYLFLPLFLGHEFSIHFRQNLFAMRSPAYGPNLAIWGSTPKNGLICEENLSQFQGNVQSCPKRLRHRWQNEICKYTGDILVFSASLFYPPSHIYTTLHVDNISSGNRYCQLCTKTKKTWFNLETCKLFVSMHSHLSNKRGRWNKQGGWADFIYYIKHARRGFNFVLHQIVVWLCKI